MKKLLLILLIIPCMFLFAACSGMPSLSFPWSKDKDNKTQKQILLDTITVESFGYDLTLENSDVTHIVVECLDYENERASEYGYYIENFSISTADWDYSIHAQVTKNHISIGASYRAENGSYHSDGLSGDLISSVENLENPFLVITKNNITVCNGDGTILCNLQFSKSMPLNDVIWQLDTMDTVIKLYKNYGGAV